MSTTTQTTIRGAALGGWPRSWRAAAGLTSVAAGAVILLGAFLPWVEAFAGLVQVPGVRGSNGQILAAAGAAIACAASTSWRGLQSAPAGSPAWPGSPRSASPVTC